MPLVKLVCPQCGAPLKATPGEVSLSCNYCGSRLSAIGMESEALKPGAPYPVDKEACTRLRQQLLELEAARKRIQDQQNTDRTRLNRKYRDCFTLIRRRPAPRVISFFMKFIRLIVLVAFCLHLLFSILAVAAQVEPVSVGWVALVFSAAVVVVLIASMLYRPHPNKRLVARKKRYDGELAVINQRYDPGMAALDGKIADKRKRLRQAELGVNMPA
ncbi:MAG: TFIIB-type zinc ribbon-containing protein [Anaerolineae bacterium]